MARDFGRMKTSIWSTDTDWLERTEGAQRLYMLAISQPDITYAGVLPHRPRRWSGMAKDSSVAGIRRAVKELESHGYFVIDEDTEELLVRTFIRHDGILTQPNVTRAMVKAFRNILSTRLRDTVLRELAREYLTTTPADRDKGWEVVTETSAKGGMWEDLEATVEGMRAA